MTARVRTALPQDAAALHQLLREITTRSFDFPQDALQRYWQDWSVLALEERCRGRHHVVLGAWSDVEPVGLVFGTAVEGGVGTIIWLLVEERHARRGIGTTLFAEAARCYRELGAHKLKLTAPSARARDFYLRQGMEVEGFHGDHWWHRDFWALGLRLLK